MKWNRRQLSQLRTLYLFCATLIHLPGAGSPGMLLLAAPWFICYVLSYEWFHVIRFCAIGCSIAEFVMFALPMLMDHRPGTELNVFCMYYTLIFLIIIIGTIFYWPAKK